MLNSFTSRLVGRSLSWLTRFAIVASAVSVVLLAVSIIALRYYLLPDIEKYHERITSSLANAIGNSVSIGKIEGDWQGLRPRLKFTDVRILDDNQLPALALQGINGSVSWMSLFTAELRLASLEISKPELLIRRDERGIIYIGSLALSKQGEGKGLSDWLLHQSRMVVRDALVVWVDEQRAAPPLVLQQVNLRIESFFSHHLFALQAQPPSELAAMLDLRGDLKGGSLEDTSDWQGQLFAQLDYTDMIAWRSWFDLPVEFSRGHGGLRGWVGIKNGRMVEIVADLDLRDVATRLSEDLPEMEIFGLHGRVAWQELADGFNISTRNLAMRLHDGIELGPTDFYFLTQAQSDMRPAGGEMHVNQIQLETITSLARYIRLDDGMRAKLDTYAPSGKLSNLDVRWQGVAENPDSYKFKGRLENIAINQVGQFPGFSGLTLDVDGNDELGRISINSRQLKVDAPGVMREPLFFTTLTGHAGWQHKRGELYINVGNITVANSDLAGNLYGSYQTKTGTKGILDFTAKLTRGDIRSAARYTPLVALHKEGSDWLNGALLAGHTEDFRIRIKGNLSDFPQDGTKSVIFKIGAHARDGVLEIGKDWPLIENITGEFLINGNKLEVNAQSAKILGANLQNISVTMPEMTSDNLPLEIRGEAEAASSEFLRYIQQSPVRGYIDGFTDGISSSGNSHLNLYARIPLLGDDRVRVSGYIQLHDNDIKLGEVLPQLRNTRGVITFTDSGIQARGVTAEILGGPASIDMQTGDGGVVQAIVQGQSDVDDLRSLETQPLLDYFHGSTAWQADIKIIKKSAQVTVESDLRGISSDLPQPFAKPADQSMPIRVEKSGVIEGQDTLKIDLGNLLAASFVRHEDKGTMLIKHGIIDLGNIEQKVRPDLMRSKGGVWLVGHLPVLSLQGWEKLSGKSIHKGPALPLGGANLQIDKLEGYGLDISNLSVNASRRGETMFVQLASDMLTGEVVWQPHGYENEGKLSVRLNNLTLAEKEKSEVTSKMKEQITASKAKSPPRFQPEGLPAMELAIENLQAYGKRIGRFELVGHPDGKDWRMRRLRITNPDSSLMGDGIWYGDTSTVSNSDFVPAFGNDEFLSSQVEASYKFMQSQVSLQLDISDAGKMLARYGYPNTVKGGSGKLVSNLTWSDTPFDFNYSNLNGTLKLDTGKGRFVKMEPGMGKLLSILSLQALPKHITLDFTDVFSEGFQFDNINGNATIKNGVLESQDFHIDGSAAKVTMKGSVDLNTETQQLQVRVLPTLGASVSLIGAFTAGPAVGLGTLLLSKVLGDPLDKLVSFEYNVSGKWSDPEVVKVVRAQPKQNNIIE